MALVLIFTIAGCIAFGLYLFTFTKTGKKWMDNL
jgi:hypothetical protein